MFHSYADLETALDDLVDEEFINGVFLRTLRSGQYTIPQLQYFAVQYSYYSRHFPRVLGAAISAMPPLDTWWVPLADNLWDEAGHGVPGKSHEQLYKTFLFSIHPHIQLDERGMPPKPMSSAVANAIQYFIDFFHRATPLEAMAAVGLGSEMFAGTVMGEIANGLRHPNYNEQPLNLLFWDVHADEHEPRHYQLCKDILVQYSAPEDLDIMYNVGAKIARSEAQMYAQLHEEMLGHI
ncbi:TenA family transcriptional regulator [Alicyclobacillus dauci]|uniref:Iron-containing redox enzyme family protein n=1 Tax=Alicyclobacillus dauci TaxID=1475485 RepID=A0ABY6Z6S6_9BACL|nr:iron-containing redox enzyme family protein [Alicyclobacillus dauci]WAH38383.1 iron-containing redox enzyme family protein [Alicyclobacillus dauci]